MKKITKISAIFIIFLLFLTNFSQIIPVFGRTASQQSGGVEEAEIINQEIKNINSDIENKKSRIKRLQDKQKKYSEAIRQKQEEKETLENHLAILDNRLAKAELDIELVKTEINKASLEIQKINMQISDKEDEIAKEKENIGNVLRQIKKQDNISTLEIILLNDSLADFMNNAKYLSDVNKALDKSLENLKEAKNNLARDKEKMAAKKSELAKLKTEYENNKKKLAAEKENKLYIIEQTNESERTYQRLLAAAKKEQQAAAAEIASMEKLVRAKLAKLDGKKLEFNDNGLIWPVPKNTITAYFHDPDYPFRNIFEHPAIDIRAAQGTPLKAAASGYVARAKNNGMGYSYIMLIHGDGLSTVYGHVSKIYVKEDEYVVQGQIIGLSGGMPGTPGAGRLTTGPHLHFEVRLNGIPVDPLSYLP